MQWKAIFKLPRFNMAGYRSQLQKELGDALAFATAEWLDAAVNAVPVWSGASRATFLPLASAISFHVSISPVKRRGGINLGLQNASADFEADGQTGRFFFKYETSLEHLIYNEFNDGNISPGPGQFGTLLNPGPYDFQAKGQASFERFAPNVGLPNPFSNISVKTLRVT
jgi:hypothetical protein